MQHLTVASKPSTQQTGSIPKVPGLSLIQYTNLLHCAHLLGIGCGHRQPIAVTCLAEYA